MTSGPPQRDVASFQAQRDVASFFAAVVKLAGSDLAVAIRLADLGYIGRDGAYSARAVRSWRTGHRIPSSDLMLAAARAYGVAPLRRPSIPIRQRRLSRRRTLRLVRRAIEQDVLERVMVEAGSNGR